MSFKLERGGTEPPKVTRNTVTDVVEIVGYLKESAGVWFKVAVEGVSTGRLHSALSVAGCEVVRRRNGTELWASWPDPDVADHPEVES